MKYKLGDIANITRGISYRGSDYSTSDDALAEAFVNLKCISADGFRWDGLKYYKGKHKQNQSAKEGDLLIANTDLTRNREIIGNSILVPKLDRSQICFSHHLTKIEILDETIVDKKYLYYLFKTPKIRAYMVGSSDGTTVVMLPAKAINGLVVDLPDLETQKKIVYILDAFGKKIDLNNQLDLILHKELNELFEKWFIRKEYPGDCSNWKKARLGDYISIRRGLSYKGKFLSDNGTPMINLGNIMPGGFFRLEKNKYYTGDYKDKVTIKAGDLVLANTDMTQKREVLGTPIIVPDIYDGDIIFTHHIYSIKSDSLPPLFLYYLLLRKKFSDIAGGGATGTTVLFLPKDIIENYEFVLPSNEAIQKFADVAQIFTSRRSTIMHENITISEIKDALLPILMSGKINIERVKL